MGKDEIKKVYCSFCGKCQDEVLAIVAGPLVFICNECTEICSDICEGHYLEKAVEIAKRRTRTSNLKEFMKEPS